MFKKGESGNKNGRPVGAKSSKTMQWEALAESIVGEHADGFNKIMNNLKSKAVDEDDIDAADLYLSNYTKILDYFKPKLQRITQVGEEGAPPVQIVISENVMKKV